MDYLSMIKKWYGLCKKNKGRAIIMMSGSGSNAIKILENQNMFEGMKIIGIFSDNFESNAYEIAKRYQKILILIGSKSFKTNDERCAYFDNLGSIFSSLGVNLLIYAGFMKIAPLKFIEKFIGVNSHPADLLIKNSLGKPKYVGMPVIKQSIENGEKYICCSCCIVGYPVDTGAVIKQSEKINITFKDLNDIDNLIEKLKEKEYLYYSAGIQELCNGTAKILQSKN